MGKTKRGNGANGGTRASGLDRQGSPVVGILTGTDLLRHVVRIDAACPPECADIIVPYP